MDDAHKGMRKLSGRSARPGRGTRRGSTMLEFALLLPIFMFMLLFVVDMGHYILLSNSMKDATYAAAMTGAAAGGAGINTASGTVVCGNGGACQSGDAYATLQDYVAGIPSAGRLGHLNSMTIASGARCQAGGGDSHVTITTSYSTAWLTPGLGSMLKMMSGSDSGVSNTQGWPIRSTAVVRCQVVR